MDIMVNLGHWADDGQLWGGRGSGMLMNSTFSNSQYHLICFVPNLNFDLDSGSRCY